MQTRRRFLGTSLVTFASSSSLFALEVTSKPKLRKAVKIGMIKAEGFEKKFALIKKLGFEGVEMDSPGCNEAQRAEAKAAAAKTGIVIHGVVISSHWSVRHSDPDPTVRSAAMKDLKSAIDDASFWGATTVLLVPGAVRDKDNENYDQVWARSTEAVKEAIPYAEKANVKIAIEVVWNNFITKPDEMIRYVDQFESPWVGTYFDCSNMLRFGVPSAEWIRQLGKRMLKFDFKGYSSAKATEANPGAGFGVGIGEGDENWPEVLKALDETGYAERTGGWATSEVGSGGEAHLKDIAERMNKALGLS
jgi:L-ribulose-5-phosphate 3-epimerase